LFTICFFTGGGSVSSRDRRHDDAYGESTQQLKRTIFSWTYTAYRVA